MRKAFVKRLLGLGTVTAMTLTGVFGQMNSITVLAEESATESLIGEAKSGEAESGEADKAGKKDVVDEATGTGDEKAVEGDVNDGKGGLDEEEPKDEASSGSGENEKVDTTEENGAEGKEEKTDDKTDSDLTDKEDELGGEDNKTKKKALLTGEMQEETSSIDEVKIDSVEVNTEVKKLGQYGCYIQ